MTVPARAVTAESLSQTDQREVTGSPEPDYELEEATRRAVKAMNILAIQSIIEGLAPPEPGPQYAVPPDYGELTGVLICRACNRPIRDHAVAEFHTTR